MNKKQEKNTSKGITLIALVMTIIVMLILVTVTIQIAVNGGIFEYARRAKEETRASKIEEECNLWKTYKKIDKETGTQIAESLSELLARLNQNGDLTKNEVDFINENGYILVGNKKIEFVEEEWNATDEKFFKWGSDDPNNGLYYRIIGLNETYASELPENIVIPKRCMDIYHWAFDQYGGENQNIAPEVFLKIKSIRIPNTVTSIGDEAFYSCKNLENIEVPDSVIRIGKWAFGSYNSQYSTKWYNAQPDGLIVLGKVAYKYKGEPTEDTVVTIPEGVVSISNEAFKSEVAEKAESKLKSIILPSTLTNITGYAFAYCKNLENITIPETMDIEIDPNNGNGSGFIYNLRETKWYENESNYRTNGISTVYFGKVLIGLGQADYIATTAYIDVKEGTKYICTKNKYNVSCFHQINIPNSVIYIQENAFTPGSDRLEKINIDKESESIQGAPWGTTNETVEIVWKR